MVANCPGSLIGNKSQVFMFPFIYIYVQDDSGLGYSDISRTDIGVQDYSIRSRDYSSRFRDYTDRSRNFSGLQDYQERSRLDYSSQRDSVESAVDYRTTGAEYSNLPRDYSRKGREEDNISGRITWQYYEDITISQCHNMTISQYDYMPI